MRHDSGIGVLDKAVVVLHAVADAPCGLAELCERTGLPRATAHRLAAGLEFHRLLARDGAGQWVLGPALSELAARVDDPLLAAGAAVLPGLREITGESVQLYRREGSTRVCVAALEPALAGQSYLVGDAFTGADIMMGYTLMLIANLAPGELPPNVAGYWSRLTDRPGFQVATKAGQAN